MMSCAAFDGDTRQIGVADEVWSERRLRRLIRSPPLNLTKDSFHRFSISTAKPTRFTGENYEEQSSSPSRIRSALQSMPWMVTVGFGRQKLEL
ncbi:unnamed protein product [Cochlearia groenlandica]